MRRIFLVVGMVMTIGCTKPNPKSCIDNHCSDPDLPFCDIDGSIGGEPNTCIAVDCTPGAFQTCNGDRALTCNSSGDNFELVACEYGCSTEAAGCLTCETPECEKRIIPRYLPTVCDQLTTAAALDLTGDAVLDTTNELNCSSVVQQAQGPEICVVRHSSISISQNATYAVSGSRALALVADRDVVVQGTIDVSAEGSISGPGGGVINSGTCTVNAGGGGAGGRTAGGSGSTASVGGAGNAGAGSANPASLAVLVGGTKATAVSCYPGGGGGALTLVSCRGTISIQGLIDANGGGGGGFAATVNTHWPAGGGSGGTVVLQAMGISISGQLFANGGGGGGGCGDTACQEVGGGTNLAAGRGSDGQRSATSASGGFGDVNGGTGGRGGSLVGPTDGDTNSGGAIGGAGGGAAGFLLTYTPEGVTPTLNPLVASPAFEPNGTIPTN